MANKDSTRIKVADAYLDEYKDMQQEIRLRIDLQHRNMNVLMAIITAVTGYVAKFASDNGGVQALYINDVVFFIAIIPIVTVIFIWRHLDHDVNIIDKAAYIKGVLKPALERELGRTDVLGWEAFLHARRKDRPRRLGPFLALGKEDIPMFFVLAAYLFAGWHVWTIEGHAGGARTVFDWLLYIGSGFALIALAMAIAVGMKYNSVGASTSPNRQDPSIQPSPDDTVHGPSSTASASTSEAAPRLVSNDRDHGE